MRANSHSIPRSLVPARSSAHLYEMMEPCKCISVFLGETSYVLGFVDKDVAEKTNFLTCLPGGKNGDHIQPPPLPLPGLFPCGQYLTRSEAASS